MFVLLQRLTQNSFYIVTIIANMLRTDYILKLKLMLAIVSAVLCVRSSFALGYSCFADISNVDAQVSFATYYDANCNITAISRGGMETEVNGTRIDIDDLTLSYSGNQLMQVTDSGEDSGEYGVMEFIDHSNVANEYAYDANGNMTRDLNKGIANITYNLLNLPGEITFSDGRKVKYIYTADGAKVRTTYFDTTGSQTLQVDYCGNYILRNGVVDRILTPSGYIKNDTVYSYVKDYQGNIRSIVRQDGAVVESTDYYPYGTPFTTANSVQPYKYGTKELDRMHGLDLYDSQARWYDSLTGRTTTMDPLAEKYYSLSPYLWCAGNPVKYGDERGDSIAVLSFQNNGWRHIALLIQDEDNKWRYFSVNGDVIWNESYGAVGLPKDDLGEHSFISPYDFLECEYNSSGSYLNKKINTYGYDFAYIIPSSPGQDIEMIDSFKSSSKKRYDLITNNCATAVNNAISKAFKMRISSWWPESSYDEIKKRIKGKEVKK